MNITLALGGGGVKGFAHIGSLRVLEAEGFHIRGIAGTSAGGLVGGLYASGYSPDEIEARLIEVDQGDLFVRKNGDGPALFGFSGVNTLLAEMLGERTFSEMRIPIAITATDLTLGLPVVFKEGRLIDALLASSALPGVFPAKSVDGHVLVDGAVTNPIPVAEARLLFPDLPVIAVILSPPVGWQQKLNHEDAAKNPTHLTNIPLVYKLAGRLRLAQAFNIFLQSMDLSNLVLLEKQLQLENPEVIIRPDVWHYGSLDRVNIAEIVKLGEAATRDVLPDIHQAVRWPNRLRQRAVRWLSPH